MPDLDTLVERIVAVQVPYTLLDKGDLRPILAPLVRRLGQAERSEADLHARWLRGLGQAERAEHQLHAEIVCSDRLRGELATLKADVRTFVKGLQRGTVLLDNLHRADLDRLRAAVEENQ